MVGVSRVKDIIESKADFVEVELDSIERVGTTSDGDRYRVLETDADSEIDQVGFEITYPESSPMAEQMFRDRVEGYLNALADSTSDDGDTDESAESEEEPSVAETPDEGPRRSDTGATVSETSQQDPRNDHSPSTSAPDVETTLDVAITAESVAELRAELDGITADDDALAELEARIDDVESRLERVEGALDALASISTDEGPLSEQTE
jgi:hypothetical protein